MLEIVQTELDKLKGKVRPPLTRPHPYPSNPSQSWILDGFPRTLRQAALLDTALNEQGRPLNMIIHLAVPDAVIIKRISGEFPRWRRRAVRSVRETGVLNFFFCSALGAFAVREGI
jgi:adenylate kinase family enzyme